MQARVLKEYFSSKNINRFVNLKIITIVSRIKNPKIHLQSVCEHCYVQFQKLLKRRRVNEKQSSRVGRKNRYVLR